MNKTSKYYDEAIINQKIAQLDSLGKFLDSSFTIPGVNIRMGWDSIIGLIPGVGDFLGAALSSYIIGESVRMGVKKRHLAKMSFNTLVDFAFGSVPVVGDAFDVYWKANIRNIQILKKHLENERDLNVIDVTDYHEKERRG